MLHLKAPDQFQDYDPFRGWGRFTRYLEIDADLYPARHVDVYENGCVLRYDRRHWVDGFGMLADLKFSPKWETWWGPSIGVDPGEFDEVWRSAERSPLRRAQIETARMDELGAVPDWLARKDA